MAFIRFSKSTLQHHSQQLISLMQNQLHLFMVDAYYFDSKYEHTKENLRRNIPRNGKSKYLIPERFPYYGCKIKEVDFASMKVIAENDAEEWTGKNVKKPYYKKNKRYLDNIKAYAETHGR